MTSREQGKGAGGEGKKKNHIRIAELYTLAQRRDKKKSTQIIGEESWRLGEKKDLL